MPIRLSLVRRQIIWLPSWLIRHRVRLAGEQLGVPSDPRRKEATVVSMLSKGAVEMPRDGRACVERWSRARLRLYFRTNAGSLFSFGPQTAEVSE
jgi:hypothetical protein